MDWTKQAISLFALLLLGVASPATQLGSDEPKHFKSFFWRGAD